jgi:drug/metabolite transporter (DMT)-like permease
MNADVAEGTTWHRVLPRSYAVLAAILFGAATPLSKMLLGELHPIVLAGLLYLGAGLGAGLILTVRGTILRREVQRARRGWERRDVLVLAGAILAGGVLAPIMMMYGLRAAPAATASLMLNFEIVATALIATALFREAIGARAWLAIALVTVAGCILAWRGEEPWGMSAGVLGILGACVLWGLDNNLTRIVSAKDPIVIVCVKGLSAGAFSLTLGMVVGADLPSLGLSAAAIALGSVSFGASIALYIRALQDLGAARTGALFGIAPFFGALVSMAIFPEIPGVLVLAAFPLMAAGAALLFLEAHRHPHRHPELFHDHWHSHDDGHHEHGHESGERLIGTRHSHPHRHEATTHDHPHSPDLHHRHDHRSP